MPAEQASLVVRGQGDIENFKYASSFTEITPELSAAFCEVTGDLQKFHLSEEEARASFFGKRVAPGLLTTSLVIKSMWEMHRSTGYLDGLEVISLKFNAKYLRPVEVGTSVQFVWTRLGLSSKMLSGELATVCDWRVEVIDSRGDLVGVHDWTFGYV